MLISAIRNKHPGKILVVGGGINAPTDLEAVAEHDFSAVISANGHAFHFDRLKVDYIVCKDHRHTETKERMSRLLRVHGVPIISRHYWADYRLADWPLDGNSGLVAIAVAALLGATDIYPVGFDFFQEGAHFHEPNARNVSCGRPPGDSLRKAATICEWIRPANIHPVSGPLLRLSGIIGTGESATYGWEKGVEVKVRQPTALPFAQGVTIVPGTKVWVSEKELKNHAFNRDVKRC